MKKLMMIVITFVIFLTGCTEQKTANIVDEISKNSNFEYGLLTVVTEEIQSKFNIMVGFGVDILVDTSIDPYSIDINEYMQNNATTYYSVTAYPDYINGGRYITRIETSDPEIYIYGLSIGDVYTEDEIVLYMESLGFYPHDSMSSAYVKELVRIRVDLDDGAISKLTVEVEITNKSGIVF